MKKTSLLLAASIFTISCQWSPDGYDIDGKPFSLAPYHGKWLIINYWAPWCAPCLKEMPDLNVFHLKYSNSVAVLGVSFDDLSKKEIQDFAKKRKILFPLVKRFSQEKWGIPQASVLPTTLIISPDRKHIKILQGPQTQRNLLKIIRNL